VHKIIKNLGYDNEIVKTAGEIEFEDDKHNYIGEIVARMNEEREIILRDIIDAASKSSKWEDFIKDVKDWFIEKQQIGVV